jgi:hypothetical protein
MELRVLITSGAGLQDIFIRLIIVIVTVVAVVIAEFFFAAAAQAEC